MMSNTKNTKKKESKPFIPIYHRDPNKFSHYENVDFTDRIGNRAILRMAHFFNKSGQKMEMVAQVKWIDD